MDNAILENLFTVISRKSMVPNEKLTFSAARQSTGLRKKHLIFVSLVKVI